MRIGKRHIEILGSWMPSVMGYGTAAGLTFLYFTDWKVINRYIPFYGGKFDE